MEFLFLKCSSKFVNTISHSETSLLTKFYMYQENDAPFMIKNVNFPFFQWTLLRHSKKTLSLNIHAVNGWEGQPGAVVRLEHTLYMALFTHVPFTKLEHCYCFIIFRLFITITILCDFVVRDIKIGVYLESLRKINFNWVSDFLSKWNSSKKGFNS